MSNAEHDFRCERRHLLKSIRDKRQMMEDEEKFLFSCTLCFCGERRERAGQFWPTYAQVVQRGRVAVEGMEKIRREKMEEEERGREEREKQKIRDLEEIRRVGLGDDAQIISIDFRNRRRID